jgi:hypothetical protein
MGWLIGKSLFGRYANTRSTTDLKKRFHNRYGIRTARDGASSKTTLCEIGLKCLGWPFAA